MKQYLKIDRSLFRNAGKGRSFFCTLFFVLLFCFIFLLISVIKYVPAYAATEGTVAENANIRSETTLEEDNIIGVMLSGEVFDILGEEIGKDGNTWVRIQVDGEDAYILRELIDTEDIPPDGTGTDSDDIQNTRDIAGVSDTADVSAADSAPDDEETGTKDRTDSQSANQPSWSGRVLSDAEFEELISGFPESYRTGLRSVHEAYPNYTFTADYIDIDFEELVDAQVGKKVSAYFASSWKAMYDESFGYYENYDWDTGEWMNSEGEFTYASREVIAHFTDPRNFITPDDIYMFMRQSYSSDQTIDDVRSIIDGTFLSEGYVPDDEVNDLRLEGDYAKVIMEAGQLSGCSPFVLAASILLEHGYYGQTPLISGYYEADDGTVYEGYYNFFDIGATGTDSDNVIQNGLEYAKEQGWVSRYLSIVDGADWITDSYIGNGQDTYYYKEFNVINGMDALWHQFSTGVMTAYSSSRLLRQTLSQNRYAALDFRIPVYNNMPDEPAEEPDYNDELNNYYFTDMQAEGLKPEFSMANRNYTMTVTQDTVLDIAVPEWAAYEGSDSYILEPGENEILLDVRSQTGYLRTYIIKVTSSTDLTLTINTYVGNHLNISESEETGEKVQEDEKQEIQNGDANGDGKITSADYVVIRNHIMQNRVISDSVLIAAADANNDGKINSLDYITLKNMIMAN